MNSIPQTGSIYWTIHPSTEAEDYGYREPQRPYRCMVMDQPHRKMITYRCCAVDLVGRPDEDSNATAYCKPDELFSDYADALSAYRKACLAYASELEEAATLMRQEATIDYPQP